MPNSVDAAAKTAAITGPLVDFAPTVLAIQDKDDSVCTSAYVERGPYLPLRIEGMDMGVRMIGNAPTHVAGFTRVPTSSGDHWYISRN